MIYLKSREGVVNILPATDQQWYLREQRQLTLHYLWSFSQALSLLESQAMTSILCHLRRLASCPTTWASQLPRAPFHQFSHETYVKSAFFDRLL